MRSPFQLESLRDWLRTKPKDEGYKYSEPYGCLIFQYLKAVGIPVEYVTPGHWGGGPGKARPLSDAFKEVSTGYLDASELPVRTFGAALARCERLVEEKVT